MLIGGGVLATLGLIFLLGLAKLALDVVSGKVVMAEGFVQRTYTVTHTRYGYSYTYYFQLNKVSLQVSAAAYNAFIDGIAYRLYFTPLSKKLVAIEPL